MSKPLELTIFEKESGRYGREPLYNSPDGFWAYPASHVDGYAANKHLTDAELAAEFHKAASDFMSANSMDLIFDDDLSADRLERARAWMFYMESFATLPHYDEVDE